ncbi:MAG: sigma-70 family RNA polymerase sigma factor [Alicyclobacillus herbarius]|uniref:sigma-70 family RNA polymerase sigma factor n=1 Tax=Alicyclobacillus herbarius TaxID=122960 RepID=UPI002356D313|nr:sigma-70 family RNA polymerase sigma factor [Alicyclobacillus herbarius]MCL6631807.1 sigma-70 family RNA polymerase sigma factor [Alicyclobacillus herbarius]
MQKQESVMDTLAIRLQQAQAGDAAAIAEIVQQFQGMVIAIARRYRRVSLSDAIQEGYASLLTAIRLYNPSLGVPFAAYARRKVHGDVRSAMRKLWTHAARIQWEDEEERDIPAWEVAATLAQNSQFDAFSAQEWSLVFETAGLTKRERLVTEALAAGWRIKELATALGVSQETVKTWRKRGLAKLRKNLGTLRQ